MNAKRGSPGRRYGKVPRRSRRYPPKYRLKAVKLYLEEGISFPVVCEQMDIAANSLRRWTERYQEEGEEGLRDRNGGNRMARLPVAVREKIVETKRNDPDSGCKRISTILRRMFFLPASAETVRKTLHEEKLISPPVKKKRKKNIARPRFFERSTPNQLWQSDIFTFKLGGRYAYLIGYIDDFSRYIVGLDCFRSQTAENVLEVYRRAVGEYNPPKEMLTDNGRQYASWRGTTRFEQELKKDGVRHIRSQPHHPMTLGKIERFWHTIFEEFLSRAQFESFESARERITFWIRYYNHRRPHQGIKGLCPADRYFEVQSALRETIQSGIEDNILEMALRGKPRAPFYMVGRMEGQSVVLRAEKGKLRMSVNEDRSHCGEQSVAKELIYELNGKDTGDEKHDKEPAQRNIDNQCTTTVPGSTFYMDGAVQPDGCMSPARCSLDRGEQLAETGPSGNAGCVRAAGQGTDEAERVSSMPSPASSGQELAGQREVTIEKEAADSGGKPVGYRIIDHRRIHVEETDVEGAGTAESRPDPRSNQWPDECYGCGTSSGYFPQEFLQVAAAGNGRYAGSIAGTTCGPAGQRSGYRERTAQGTGENHGRTDRGSSAEPFRSEGLA